MTLALLDAVTDDGLELRPLRASGDNRVLLAPGALDPMEASRGPREAENPLLFAGPCVNLRRYRLEP